MAVPVRTRAHLAAVVLVCTLLVAPPDAYAAFADFKECVIKKLVDLFEIGVIIALIALIWEKLTGEIIAMTAIGGAATAEAATAAAAGGLTGLMVKIAKFVGKKLIPFIGFALLLAWLLWLLVDCLPHLAGYNGIQDLIDKLSK